MKTEALDFCKKYQQSIRNKEIFREDNKINPFTIKFDKKLINFYIVSKEIGRYEDNTFLLKLDKEDLQYLYEKYSKKAKEELEQNLEELKKELEENIEGLKEKYKL